MSVILYSSHCVNCNLYQCVMDKKGIGYKIVDDENVYLPIADSHHITSMPFADVDGTIMDTKQLELWIKKQ